LAGLRQIFTRSPAWPFAWPFAWSAGRDAAAAADAVPAALYVSGSAVALAHGRLSGVGGDGHSSAPADLLQVHMRADALPKPAALTSVLAEQVKVMSQVVSLNRCNLVLAPEMYNLNLVERPEVEAEDVVDAVRWSIQDQVEYPVDDAVIDVFDLPNSASRERPMVFVVSAQRELLGSLVQRVMDQGLQVSSVDVSELALRNLVWRCFPEADQSVALLRLTANSGLVSISRGDELYLSRRISGVPGVFAEDTWDEFRERMLLQVQRSIDYYESAMAQPHCNVLTVACTHGWSERVCEYLAGMLAIPVRSLSPLLQEELQLNLFNPQAQQIDWQALTSEQTNAIAAGLPALGGMLRPLILQHSEAA